MRKHQRAQTQSFPKQPNAMAYTHLISAPQLHALMQEQAPLMVFDCSYELADPAAADAQFSAVRIAGAEQAHQERDLSTHDPKLAVNGGRHPLPQREHVAQWLSRIGFRNDMQAVVYDRQSSVFAGRLWWMLKWLGHDAVAVLDGGLSAWQAAGAVAESDPLPTEQGVTRRRAARAPSQFALKPALRQWVSQQTVAAQLGQAGVQTLIDARARPRFLGEIEPMDPVAGHIPGALNRPSSDNVDAVGRFKPAAQLRTEFEQLLAGRQASTVVQSCGSGISAISNLFAMELAGYAPTPLYAGSWSEWCSTPGAPVATGA